MNVEAGFLASLIYSRDSKFLTEHRIKPSLFVGKYRNAFKYVQEYLLEHGEIPPKSVVARYFPDLGLPSRKKIRETKLSWWAGELRRKATHNKIADAVEKIYDQLESRNPEEARKIMEATLSDIAKVATVTRDLNIPEVSELLKEEYKRVAKSGGIVGIPTKIKSLDSCLGGFDKEQFINIIARTNQGKTWFLLILLFNIWRQGYRVALGTREMSEKQMAVRFMSLYAQVPHSRLRLGILTKSERKRYFKALRDLKREKHPFVIFYVDGGVTFLRSKVEEIKPDILGVDGVYLIDDDIGSDSDWGRVTNISRGVKRLCQSCKIPIIGTNQANRATSRKTGPEVDNISYSDALAQDSDVVIGMNQTEEMRNDREIEIRILKARDSGRGKLMMSWDFNNMKFEEIYSDLEFTENETVRANVGVAKSNSKVVSVEELVEIKKKTRELYGTPPKGVKKSAKRKSA